MKNIYKILFLSLTLLLVVHQFGQSQTARETGDRIKTKKIAFFTEKLQLTPDEAQKFWPVFNEYDAKKNTLLNEKRKLTENFQANATKIKDSDADNIMNKYVQLTKQEALLMEEYNKRFRQILSAQKVMKLYLAETEFKIVLLRELKANSKADNAN